MQKEEAREREFEVVVWGATGFTGKLVCDYLAREYGDEVNWAVAGRDEVKLKKIGDELLLKYPTRLKNVRLVLASSENFLSLSAMASRTSVILSTVGPFAKYGTELIRACVQNNTHYADITGEATWVKSMINEFHDAAQKNGTYIVNCCGMDCIPSDLNAFLLNDRAKQKYGKECSEVKGYHSFKGPTGVSGGTAASIVNAFDEAASGGASVRGMRKPFFLNSGESQNKRGTPFEQDQILPYYDNQVNRWCRLSLFALCDNRVVRRSQQLLKGTKDSYGEQFSYNETELASSLIEAIIWTFAIVLFFVLMNFNFTRKLLHKYVLPASGQGPKEEDRAKVTYQYRGVGKLANPAGSDPKTVSVVMKCGDVGYTDTAKMLAETGLCLLKDRDQFVLKGGVLTPASCMGNSLAKRLAAKGFIFTYPDS